MMALDDKRPHLRLSSASKISKTTSVDDLAKSWMKTAAFNKKIRRNCLRPWPIPTHWVVRWLLGRFSRLADSWLGVGFLLGWSVGWLAVGWFVDLLVGLLVAWLIGLVWRKAVWLVVCWYVGLLVGILAGWSVGWLLVGWCVGWVGGWVYFGWLVG